MAGVVTLAFSPIMDLRGASLIQSQTSTSYKYEADKSRDSSLFKPVLNQDYIVLKVNTVSQKSFNVMAFKHETVSDVKNRIQSIEGIPQSYQVLNYEGRELSD